MNELDTRAERFLESIRAEGEAACAAIRTETDAEIDRQLDEARQAQQAKAEHTLHFETERARTRANRELSAARMQARAKLAAQRQQIAADAFAAARTQLATFAAGKDYAAWLVKSAAALAETMGESSTLYARTADLPCCRASCPPVWPWLPMTPSPWAACALPTPPPAWLPMIRWKPAWTPSTTGSCRTQGWRSRFEGQSYGK